MEYICNLQQGNGWASFGICGYVPEERKEEKEDNMTSKRLIVTGHTADDLGPQRFCPDCGVKLVQIFNPLDEDEYKHPNTGECDQDDLIIEEPSTGRRKKERMVRTTDEDLIDNIVLRRWKPSIPKTRAQLIEFNRHFGKLRAAIAGHNKQVGREKEGKSFSNPDRKPLWFLNMKKTVVMYFEAMSDEATTKWLKDNWDALTLKAEIPNEPDTLPLLYKKDGELITDPHPDDVENRMDAPLRTDGETWLSGTELSFFNKLSWKIGHNPSAIPEMVEELDAEWMDEITGSGVAHNPKWIQRSFNGKDKRFVFRWWYDDTTSEEDECFTKRDYILGLSEGKETSEYRYAKKLIIRASKQKPKFKVLGDYGHYNWKEEIVSTRRTYIGSYTRKDGTVVKGHYRRVTGNVKAAAIANLRKARKKTMVVHYYKCTSSCPEGFMNIWTKKGGKINGHKQHMFLKVEDGRSIYKKLRDKAISAGYEVEFHDMDKEATAMGRRWPSRQRARLLWNSPGRYIGLVKAKMLADMIC